MLADPEVEAVYIASPVQHHARQIMLCAEAGKHILCEKPLTRDLREARKAAAVCRKRGVFLQEGYMMKFHGAHVKIKELIDKERLGRIVYLRPSCRAGIPRSQAPGGKTQRMEAGALIDMASHLYDLIEYFAGPIRKITALAGNLVQDYKLKMPRPRCWRLQSGAQATVDCFFCIPDEASRTRLEIYGSAGAVLAEGTIGQSSGGKVEALLGVGPTVTTPSSRRTSRGNSSELLSQRSILIRPSAATLPTVFFATGRRLSTTLETRCG